MPIVTPRLLIRPPRPGDGVKVNEAIIESYEILHTFMEWARVMPSIEDTEEQMRLAAANWILKKPEEPWLQLLIFDKTSNEFIGCTSFHHYLWDIPSVETGYWIRTARSGQGFMTEAINAITRYAFKQLAVKRISLTCDIDNIRSKKIAERLNYTLEATLKNHRITPIFGEISDTLVYSKYDTNHLPSLLVHWGSNEAL